MIQKDGKNYITSEDLPRLKRLYNKAVKEGKESFMYEGNEILTSYCKYLIEYMDTLNKNSK